MGVFVPHLARFAPFCTRPNINSLRINPNAIESFQKLQLCPDVIKSFRRLSTRPSSERASEQPNDSNKKQEAKSPSVKGQRKFGRR